MNEPYAQFVRIKWTGYNIEDCKNKDIVEAALTAGAISEEAGELFGEFKKALRDDNCITNERRRRMICELGDLLYYVTKVMDTIAVDSELVMQVNRAKLTSGNPKKFVEDYVKRIRG